MRYGSVCSGIEAASCAWHPLGWKPQWFAEIEKFPSRVLAHHYPHVPNLGDFTKIGAEHGPIDLLVGGTPCQSFSVAGLRGGMADARGSLALEFLRLAERTRAEWLVWENVPGVLSSGGGRDFGSILGGMVELGYGFAYRVLDAQYFGLAQRRKRVFVVARLGDWRGPAAVLFERAGLRGDPPPRQTTEQEVAGTLGGGSGARPESGAATLIAFGGNRTSGPLDVAAALQAHGGPHGRQDFGSETFITQSVALRGRDGGATIELGDDKAFALRSSQGGGDKPHITHALRAEGFDASEDGTGRGTPLVSVSAPIHLLEVGARCGEADEREGLGVGAEGDPMFTLQGSKQHGVAFTSKGYGQDAGDVSPTLRAGNHVGRPNGVVGPVVAFHNRQDPDSGPVTHPIGAKDNGLGVNYGAAVRRLTPRECERLQGFPDGWTDIPGYDAKRTGELGGNRGAADGPRYRALGNSMAVPVMRWIGKRIELVHRLTKPPHA